MEIQSNAGTRHYRSVEAGSEMGKKNVSETSVWRRWLAHSQLTTNTRIILRNYYLTLNNMICINFQVIDLLGATSSIAFVTKQSD